MTEHQQSTVAPARLPAREPVRAFGTIPATILATTGAIVALGVGSPLTALGCATGLTVVGVALELVRSRVMPVAGAVSAAPVSDPI